MSIEPPGGRQVEGGVFTPWEKVFERLDRQNEQILVKLDTKVSIATFQRFEELYEQRHERMMERLDKLEDDKVSRDAIAADRRVLYLGGGALALVALVNLIINLTQSGGLP